MLPLLAIGMLSVPPAGKQPYPLLVPDNSGAVVLSSNAVVTTDRDVVRIVADATSSNYTILSDGSWQAMETQDSGGMTKTVWERPDEVRFVSFRPTPSWTLSAVRTTNYSPLGGSLVEHVLTNQWARTNKSQHIFSSLTFSNWVYNTNCSIYGLKGATALNVGMQFMNMSVWGTYHWMPLVALTKRHAISAGHQGGEGGALGVRGRVTTNLWNVYVRTNSIITWWVDSNNVPVKRHITGKFVYSSNDVDVVAVVLDEDLPDSIPPMKVFSYGALTSDMAAPSVQAQPVTITNITITTNWITPYNYITRTNVQIITNIWNWDSGDPQWAKAQNPTSYLSSLISTNAYNLLPAYPNGTCQHWRVNLGLNPDNHYSVMGGDSGSAWFYLVNGELAFVFHVNGLTQPQPGPYLQDMIDELSRAVGLNPSQYQIQPMDLSAWPTLQ